jgi:hypothetical protein
MSDSDEVDYFKDKYYEVVDIINDLEERMEKRGGATIQDVPNFVFLTQYDESVDLSLPDHVNENEEDEYVIGKGIHRPQDILSYAFFLLQTIASDNMLGPEKTSEWLREVRQSILNDNEEAS